MFNLWPKSMPEQENLFKKKKLDSTLQFEMHWQHEWDKFMNEIDDSVIDMIEHIDSKTQNLFFDLIKKALQKRPINTKNIEQDIVDFFNTVRKYREQLFPAVNRICDPEIHHIDIKDEKTILFFFQNYANDEFIKKLLFNTSFLDNCFAKGSRALIQHTMDVFKRDIPTFKYWLGHVNSFLKQGDFLSKSDKREIPPTGYDYILHSDLFASVLRTTIPLKDLSNSMLLAMGSNAMHKSNSEQNLISFIRIIEKLPTKRQEEISNTLLLFINDVLQEEIKNNESIYDIQKIKSLLTQAKSPILKKELGSFLKHLYPLFWNNIKKLNFSDEEYKSMIQLTLLSHDWNKLFDLKDSDQNAVIWGLYRKGLLNKDDLSKIVKQAILQKRNGFLLAPKDMAFSSNIPCFSDLKGYFSDQPQQAYTFINSFQRKETDEHLFSSIKSFIESPSFRLYFVKKNKMLNKYAKKNNFEGILSFFYNKDSLDFQNPPCSVDKETCLMLSSLQDEEGKTLWHYACEIKEKSLFRKNLKFLIDTFLNSCQIQDSLGKTPLDYARNDLKFLKYLTTKIPQVEKILKAQGISAEYVKQPPTEKKKSSLPQKEVEVKKENIPTVERKEWIIEYRGNDPYWKDEDYLSTLRQEIQTFPDPYSSEMHEKQHREMKEHHYSVSAFKMVFHQKKWRVPYITNGQTLYIFPGCERDYAYRAEHAGYIKKLAKQLKQDLAEHKRS